MYQSDISGQNAIDEAFKKDAVFCIKAFVETLIILTDEVKFRNCFDKALLMMISKGMDVKELVSSELFFATIWKNLSLFSSVSEPVIIAYNDNVEDLDFEDPNLLFTEALQKNDQGFNIENLSELEKNLITSRKTYYDSFFTRTKNSRGEEYEMQYSYLYME
jgi:hypothetical protein